MKTKWILFLWLATPHFLVSQVAELVPAAPFGEKAVKKDQLLMDGMNVEVRFIDNIVRVRVTQVYYNRSGDIVEGRYRMYIRGNGMLDEFAIWENGERLRGVILEKKRAKSLYEEIKYLQIDPGLAARPEGEESHQSGIIDIKVAPIQPYSYKKIEFSYVDTVPIIDFNQYFTLFIAPRSESGMPVNQFTLSVSGRSSFDIEKASEDSLLHADLNVKDNRFALEKSFSNWVVRNNLTFHLLFKRKGKIAFHFYRNPDEVLDFYSISRDTQRIRDEDGYFLAVSLLKDSEDAFGGGKYVFILDLSTSIPPESLKLEIEGLSRLLARLKKKSLYRVYYFNSDLVAVDEGFQPPEPTAVKATFDKIYRLKLSSGSNLGLVLNRFASQPERPVLFTDGFPTLGEIRYPALGQMKFSTAFFLIGLGQTRNDRLLSHLADASSGYYQPLDDSAAAAGKLDILSHFLESQLFSDIRARFDAQDIRMVYPEKLAAVFPGNDILIAGKYREPGKKRLNLVYQLRGRQQQEDETVLFPEKETETPEVAKVWANQRIDLLLEKIASEGEKREWVDEIVALSKRFMIVTPYTSMLAAHRSYLLPDAMQPADPLLIVKAHPDVVSVEADLPFGEAKPMRYLPAADHWRCRFLVPEGTRDGVYSCTIVLKDKWGQTYVEKKKFRVDSAAPIFRMVPLREKSFSGGDLIRFEVKSPADTRRIVAFNPVIGKTELRYDRRTRSSVGFLKIGNGIPPGAYPVQVEAVDFAANQFSKTVIVEVH